MREEGILLPDSKELLSSSEGPTPASDDNTATKPSLNSSKLTCVNLRDQHYFQQNKHIIPQPFLFSLRWKHLIVAFCIKNIHFIFFQKCT